MKETIILSSINSRELLRSLSNFGYKFINVRFFNAYDLAKEALLRSGKTITLKEIDISVQEFIINNLIKENDYFKDNSFEDAKNITKAINNARLYCRDNEKDKLNDILSDGEFKEKNIALLDIYKRYIKYLDDNSLIDSIGVINYAINNANVIDSEFKIFNELPLLPLEEELLDKVSNNYISTNIPNFVGREFKKLNNISYDNGYGSINELEHILAYIAKNNIAYEDVTIATCDNSYLSHLISLRDTYNIPMTFSTGLDLSLSTPYKVMSLLDKWNQNYNSIDAYIELFNSNEFNSNKLWANVSTKLLSNKEKEKILNILGNLRITVNKDNKLENYKSSLTGNEDLDRYLIIENIANEFNKGYAYLIKNYTNISNETFDTKAINIICEYINEYYSYIPLGKLEDIIDSLSNMRINKELSKTSHIHITDLRNALSSIRKHLFICGLNAKTFPGAAKEDYLLLDSDLERFNEELIEDSSKKIIHNKELLMNVIENANAFDTDIHLSYAGYNLSELKEENPSSMFFEIYKKEYGDDATTDGLDKLIGIQHNYFDEDINSLKNIGNEYLKGINLINKNNKNLTIPKTNITQPISPSAAEKFFTCPRLFYLRYVLGIKEPEDHDPYKTIAANDEGTLIHECMEDYGNNPNWTKDEFMANALNKFNNYFKMRMPIHKKDIDDVKDNFLNMALAGYETDPHLKVDRSEAKLGPYIEPITGLTFAGIVDRIEELDNGHYQIVDYKTYKDIKNTKDDIDTCFQVVLYAYLLENTENKIVDRCEYRYLRNVRSIECIYNDGMKSQLQNRLSLIKEALDNGNFPYPDKYDQKDACRYCKMGHICGVNDVSNKEGNE